MHTQQVTSDESSVVFNLRQLMQLEQDRLQVEADAVRERQAAAERARVERAAAELARETEREAAELARQTERVQQAERAEIERQASLLRVQLEADALERGARERRALEHAREREAGKRARAAILAGGLCVALIGAAAAQRLLPTPHSEPAADGGAGALLATQARELEQLRQRIASLHARVEPAPAAFVTPAPQLKPKPKPSRKHAAQQMPSVGHELDGLDKDSDDPVDDL